MLESVKRLEATRSARMQQQVPRLTAAAKKALLEEFHPDYRPTAARELVFGPNAGDRVPHEVADLLEARGRIDPDAFDLRRVDQDVDVLIIGGGGAGTSAALMAHERGAKVLLVH